MRHSLELIQENFHFIVSGVRVQVEKVSRFVSFPEADLYNKIKNKESYINNLKTIIENDCYGRIHEEHDLEHKEISQIRAIMVIAANLERMADVCINVIRQMGYLKEKQVLRESEYEPMFKVILDSLDKVLPSLEREDLSQALQICRAEFVLDALYGSSFKLHFDKLLNGKPEDAGGHLTAIFIYHYLERIGDLLLNIGEQLIFAALGQRIKIEQFDSLQQTLKNSGYAKSFNEVCFNAIWGSRSGCHIGKVELTGGGESIERGSIYKEGERSKIIEEKNSLEIWNDLFPGLVPKVYGCIDEGDKASLLVEFLNGQPLNELILTQDLPVIEEVMQVLEKTVGEIWKATGRPGPFATNYIRQLKARKESVLYLHSDMQRKSLEIGKTHILSTEELIDACEEIEKQIPAPLCVRIHGDFNTNNILYDNEEKAIRFIDLHRSEAQDYVQDISVFLVSNFRVPAFEPEISRRLDLAITLCYAWVERYAREKEDHTMHARMALALARSFFTSIRFAANDNFAREMFLRSIFLLESIHAHAEKGLPWDKFTFSRNILFY